MTPDHELASGPMIESRVVGEHRGRERAKLVGAVVFILVCLAFVWRLVWSSGAEQPATTAAESLVPARAVFSSENKEFDELGTSDLGSAADHGLSPEIADLAARAGLEALTGRIAPAFAFRDVQGVVGSLEPLRGKVVLIAFWGTTCAPCLVELPELEKLAVLHEPSGFVVLPICIDETDAAKVGEVAAYVAPRLTVYADKDGSGRQAYRVRHLPQAFLIDRDGRMIARSFGNIRWLGKEFERLLSACEGS